MDINSFMETHRDRLEKKYGKEVVDKAAKEFRDNPEKLKEKLEEGHKELEMIHSLVNEFPPQLITGVIWYMSKGMSLDQAIKTVLEAVEYVKESK